MRYCQIEVAKVGSGKPLRIAACGEWVKTKPAVPRLWQITCAQVQLLTFPSSGNGWENHNPFICRPNLDTNSRMTAQGNCPKANGLSRFRLWVKFLFSVTTQGANNDEIQLQHGLMCMHHSKMWWMEFRIVRHNAGWNSKCVSLKQEYFFQKHLSKLLIGSQAVRAR